MSRYILIILFALAVCAEEPEPPPQYNFLFIVDSSISMAEKKPAVVRALRDLIRSGFQNQIEEGDSIDVWTPDSSKVDRLPPQLWGTNPGTIASTAVEFIQTEKFRRGNRLDAAMTDLGALIPSTKRLLAVLITDGSEPLSGIKLDLEINSELPKLRRQASKSKEPLIISLIAVDGELVDWRGQVGMGSMMLPELPKRPKPEPVIAKAEPAQPAAEPVKEPEPPAPVVVNYPPGTRITPVVSIASPVSEKVAPEPKMIFEAPVEVEAEIASASPAPSVKAPRQETAPVAESPSQTQQAVLSAQVKAETDEITAPPQVGKSELIEKTAPKGPNSATTAPIQTPQPSSLERDLGPVSAGSAGAAVYFVLSAGALFVLIGSILLLARGRNDRGPSLISKSLGT